MGEVEEEVAAYLLSHPAILAPLLLLAAALVIALLKRLLKVAALVAVAGGLYVLPVRYFGTSLPG